MSRAFIKDSLANVKEEMRKNNAEDRARRGLPPAPDTQDDDAGIWALTKAKYREGSLTGYVRGFLNQFAKKNSLDMDSDLIWNAYRTSTSAKLFVLGKYPEEEVKRELRRQVESRRPSHIAEEGQECRTDDSGGHVEAGSAMQMNTTAADGSAGPQAEPAKRIARKPIGAVALQAHLDTNATAASRNQLYSYSPLFSTEEGPIFRLLAVSPGFGDDTVLCRLIHHNLHNCPSCEALSYCWGEPVITDNINLHGFDFGVRQNLMEALRSIRSSNSTRMLWIDAICINQDDLEERAQQVTIMREIYERANRVLIWLGLPDKYGSDPIQILTELAETAKSHDGLEVLTRSLSLKLSAKDVTPSQQNRKRTEKDKSSSESVRYLLLRDWFSRIWTVQEVTVAQEAVIVWGGQMVDWDVISAGISEGFAQDKFHTNFLGRSAEILFQRHGALVAARTRHMERPVDRFQRLLAIFRNRKATDDRDKVFALLGLVENGFDGGDLVPNYRIPLADLYIHTAVYILNNSGDLRILAICLSNVDSELGTQLPSWVPDWSNRATIATPFEDSGLDLGSTFDTVADTKFVCSFRLDGDSLGLELEGYQTDIIANLAPSLTLPESYSYENLEALHAVHAPERPSDLSDQKVRQQLKFALHTFGWGARTIFEATRPIAAYLTTFIEWEEFANKHCKNKHGATAESVKSAYMRTLLAGYRPDGVEKLFKEWLVSLVPIRQAVKLGLDKEKYLFTAVTVAGYMKQTWHRVPEFNQLLEYTNSRRLAYTQRGHLALVPGHAKVGDVVGLFKDSSCPLVYRSRREGDWILIGQAYVDDLEYTARLYDSHQSYTICFR